MPSSAPWRPSKQGIPKLDLGHLEVKQERSQRGERRNHTLSYGTNTLHQKKRA